jgi:hypothetical protein
MDSARKLLEGEGDSERRLRSSRPAGGARERARGRRKGEDQARIVEIVAELDGIDSEADRIARDYGPQECGSDRPQGALLRR